MTSQRPARALKKRRLRNLINHLTVGNLPPATRKQVRHALLRSGSVELSTSIRSKMTIWRSVLGNLAAHLCQRLRTSLGFAPKTEGLERALSLSLLERQALDYELTQTKAELFRVRAELAGTKAGERTAQHQAMHDALTGLPNRRRFMEQLQQALNQHKLTHARLNVIYLDIDGFKRINDGNGHKVGDDVLRTVGARLSKSVRTGDMVARLGGDEFACLLVGNLTNSQLLALAKKLYLAIEAPMQLGSKTLLTHASIGLSGYPEDGETADTLLERADAAMYQAKRQQSKFMFASNLPGA